MMTTNSPVITIGLSAISLVLGLPVAVAAIIFNNNWVPDVTLGSKTINTGPGQTTTLRFGILTGPNDAVLASALISMASTPLFITGLVLIRHFTKHNASGWLAFGPALLNFLGQVACCAAAFMLNKKYPAATSTDQIRYVDGHYSTGGQLYTKEAWSCSMNALYPDKEGSWANQACSRFVSSRANMAMVMKLIMLKGTARMLTVPLVVCATCICGLACWQVVERGGFGWLFGRTGNIAEAKKPKGEYVDLQKSTTNESSM
jgi:hypothetical protein